MLKNIDPLLGPDLLKVLAEMGHDDEFAVVDANFTGRRLACDKPLVRLEGIALARACRAVLSVLPLDEAVAQPVERFAFYDLIANTDAIVQTGKLQPYGNFIFKKGVILGGAI
jgi:L-fucose mutarotase